MYLRELRGVREAGVAIDDEEYLQGVRAVAAPIFDGRGEVAAAICVVGPSARLPHDVVERLADRTRELAGGVSARLGGLPQGEPVGATR
jgi:IclR family acetate operon transcriptional repressor